MLLTHNQGVVGSNPILYIAPRQGILSTIIVSLNPGVVNGYAAQIHSFNDLSAERLHGGLTLEYIETAFGSTMHYMRNKLTSFSIITFT